MSTRKQLAAFKEIRRQDHEAHMLKTYGMLPIAARHPGKCGCGQHAAYPFRPGDKIVRFRGGWWMTDCVDSVRAAEWKAACRFVREMRVHVGGEWREWQPMDWADEPKTAALWAECAEFEEMPAGVEVRIVDRAMVTA